MSDMKKNVETLAKKAMESVDAQQALHYSQAATNVANAMCALRHATEGWGHPNDADAVPDKPAA